MQHKSILRQLVLLLALLATLLVTSAAASPAHIHAKDVAGRCDVCVIAHLPVVQPALSVGLVPPAIAELGVYFQTRTDVVELFHRTALSRGPPTLPI